MITIPDYRANALLKHLKRVFDNIRPDPSNYRMADALRLVRQDLRWLEKQIEKKDEK